MSEMTDGAMSPFTEALKSFFILTNGNRVRVEGNSMWPTIKNNQDVDISYTNTILKPGYCYAFLYDNRIIAHRFIFLKKGKAIFIGDRGYFIEAVLPNNIVGEVAMQQNIFIIGAITFINFLFVNSLFKFQMAKHLRTTIIHMLTRGVIYDRKV